MERSRPRFGSVCLPTGREKLRLVLVSLALAAGVTAGMEFFFAFKEAAEAVAVGVLTADIALHAVDLLIHALAFSRWVWVFTAELALSAAVGVPFFLGFSDTSEAISIGLMTANITLHLAELVTDRVVKTRKDTEDSDRSGDAGRFGGQASPAGAPA
ncbi:hypothetical protein ACIRQQ_38625 [Streptomyces fuscichromogenes]|uniref:hypothetical protein n=1 Tax=Streptomyces fuscichromogenes TaxID=1324013 RepID=UPI0038005D66